MAGADAEPAAAAAKQAPELSKLFPGKKKGFKATNFSGGGTKEAPKKKAVAEGQDEWDEEKLGNEKLKVAVQVEALNVGEEVETEKATWNVTKPTEAGEEKATKQYPSLAGSVKPGAQAASAGPAAPAKVEGISGDRSKFDVLNRDEEEDDDAPQESGGKDKDELAAKKAEKKEAKRLEKERRDQEEAAAKAQKEKKERFVMVDGVPDTQIKADMDRILAKYDGRRKRPIVPIDED